MKSSGVGGMAMHVDGFGRVVFAAAMIVVGIVGLARRDLPVIWSGPPQGMPWGVALGDLCAVVSLGSGVGLLWRRAAGIASRALLACFALWMLAFRVPLVVGAPTSSGMWWAWGEMAVMMAAAWALVVAFAGGAGRGFLTGDRGLRVARSLYGLGLIPFGIAHFTFLQRTVGMVPGWLPWHLGWAYFTGSTLIAAGVAIAIGVFARLAAVLSALELTLFTLLVWIPVIAAGANASDLNEFIDSCVLTAAAWVVADSWRGMAWVAVGARRARLAETA